MRIVVLGATGNIGSAVVRELASRGHEVTGVARRPPTEQPGGSVRWRAVDVGVDALGPVVRGADAVVHLAWMFQPTHRPSVTWQANAVGTRRVIEACARAGVSTVLVTSSVAAYSPGVDDRPVDESWPTDGTSSAAYAREKAYVERALDGFEAAYPGTRVVRLRPAFVFQRSAGSEQRRIFGGALVRPALLDRRRLPVVPLPAGLRLQAVHSGDVARAVGAALERPVRGAFNLAADDVLRPADVGRVLDARVVRIPDAVARSATSIAWRAHAVRAPGDLLRAMLRLPVMSSLRAHEELGWEPRHSAAQALTHMLEGARADRGSHLAPLDPDRSGGEVP